MPLDIQKGDWIKIIWDGEYELTLRVVDMSCFGMGYFGARDPEKSSMMYIIKVDANYWRITDEEETLLTIKYGSYRDPWTTCE